MDPRLHLLLFLFIFLILHGLIVQLAPSLLPPLFCLLLDLISHTLARNALEHFSICFLLSLSINID